ncbi:MAG: alpha-1,2-fucosyltransferase [Chitinophagaceae bacterium]|nr:alpha-1,2-fucosyltransferase [Chitinophagaceae bacterium]
MNAVINDARAAADVVIGVHIRRGDYIRYEAGIWYYEDDVYAEKMLQVQEQFATAGKTCAFVIAAIESIDKSHFPPALKIFTGQRHFVTDMYSLAACDAIIGPPSTFSLWAAFYGKIPLAYIYKKDDFVQIGCYYNAC